MPVISMFYGIIIRMYFLDNQHHGVPHIHDELVADWDLAVPGENPYKIDPL